MEIRDSEKARAGYRTVRLIGFGFLAALLAYWLVVEVLAAAGTIEPQAWDLGPLRVVLLLVSVGGFFASGWLRERMLRPNFDDVTQALVPAERVRRMISANIVALAMCEAVALFGLVLFLLGGARQDFYTFLVLALIFLLIRWPRAEQWQAWYAARGRLR